MLIESRAYASEKLGRTVFGLPEGDEVLFHFLKQGAVIGNSVRVDDVEDALARDDEAVAEALALGGMFTRFEFRILAFVVASEIADDV